MTYELNCKDTFEKSLLYWIEMFFKNKINKISHRGIKDEKLLTITLEKLRPGINSIDELYFYLKNIRVAGLIGVGTYSSPIKCLYEYIKRKMVSSFLYIDEEFISEFLFESTCTLSDASKKNYRMVVVEFFKFLDKKTNHHFDIKLVNWGGVTGGSGKKLPAYLKDDEIKSFIKALEKYAHSTTYNYTFAVIIDVILRTGMRVDEAINLTFRDLILSDEFYIIKVCGKGNKERMVMIKEETIKGYLSVRQEKGYRLDDYLFVSKNGKKLTQSCVHNHISTILQNAKVKKEKSGAHLLRHTFATRLYKKTKDIVLVQEALGHSDISITRLYVHFDSDRLHTASMLMDDFHS